MAWVDIPKEAYALIGTVVGGLITMAATMLNQRAQRRLEREKLREARRDAFAKDLGTRFQALATEFAAAAHSMCWLTWQADHDYMTKEDIEVYNEEIHLILPKLIGGKIAMGALDPKLGEALAELVDLAHEVDEEIGIACLEYGKDRTKGIQMLKALNKRSRDFDEVIYTRLEILGRNRPEHSLLQRILNSLRSRPGHQRVIANTDGGLPTSPQS